MDKFKMSLKVLPTTNTLPNLKSTPKAIGKVYYSDCLDVSIRARELLFKEQIQTKVEQHVTAKITRVNERLLNSGFVGCGEAESTLSENYKSELNREFI